MALIIGFNFRATVGFVTDGGDEVFVDIGDSYPTTKTSGNGQSVDFGWETAPDSERDRDSGIDSRLAGMHGESGSAQPVFRVDLKATGNHDIRAAFGEPSFTQTSEFRFRDSTTTLFTSSVREEIVGDNWADATDVLRTSESDWVTNNAKRTETFASTIFRTDINVAGIDRFGTTVIGHLFVEQVGGVTVPIFDRHYRSMRAA